MKIFNHALPSKELEGFSTFQRFSYIDESFKLISNSYIMNNESDVTIDSEDKEIDIARSPRMVYAIKSTSAYKPWLLVRSLVTTRIGCGMRRFPWRTGQPGD